MAQHGKIVLKKVRGTCNKTVTGLERSVLFEEAAKAGGSERSLFDLHGKVLIAKLWWLNSSSQLTILRKQIEKTLPSPEKGSRSTGANQPDLGEK